MRLGRIEREFGATVAVDWKSYLLRPQPRERSIERFREYTQSWQRPAAQADGGRFRPWSSEEAPPSHSVPPNIAIKAAATVGGKDAFDRYHLALMDAYFYHSRNVADRHVLIDVAVHCELDVAAFARALDDPVLHTRVLREHTEALEAGITGVPTVVVEGQWSIPGAQDMTFYRQLVRKRLERTDTP